MKILLLEDNLTLGETIKSRLELKGFEVVYHTSGDKALGDISGGFACFVLDINVPKVNGIKILKTIRKDYTDTPVIIISSIAELETIKDSYDSGCNEYLKKPFFIDELEIKIEKLCIIPNKELFFDGHSFDFQENILLMNDEKIILTPKESLLLNLFLFNKNKLVSYDSIQNYVWGGEYVSLDAIRALIKRLRQKLTLPYIKASSSSGYFFECD